MQFIRYKKIIAIIVCDLLVLLYIIFLVVISKNSQWKVYFMKMDLLSGVCIMGIPLIILRNRFKVKKWSKWKKIYVIAMEMVVLILTIMSAVQMYYKGYLYVWEPIVGAVSFALFSNLRIDLEG